MPDKQYLRNTNEGDASLEGRQSNGLTAKTDGSTIMYGPANQASTEQLESGENIDINGNTGSVFALIPAEKNIDYTEGNNNKETTQPTTDPNKITTPNKPTVKGYKTIVTADATITIPNGVTGPVSVFVLYPGTTLPNKQIGKQYMPPLVKKGIPDFYEKYVIVIPNQDLTKWESVKKEYETELKNANLSEKNLSIGIFSGSGNDGRSIQRVLTTLPNLVNLIIMDPWPGKVFSSNITKVKSTGTKVYMMYNTGNWGYYPTYPPLIKILVKNVGANATSVSRDHMSIPATTLTKFRTEIENNLGSTPTIPQSPTQTQNQQQTQQQDQQQTQQQDQIQIQNQTVVSTTPVTPESPIIQEENIPEAAPSTDGEEEKENFTFLDETGIELDPVQIFEYTVGDQIVTPSAPVQNDLVASYTPEEYKGSTEVIKLKPIKTTPTKATTPTKTTTKSTKTVLAEGVLVGALGDVNQEINLPNPIPGAKGKLPDKYRGKIPVKEVTYTSKLVSIQEMIKLFKTKGLTEQEARNMLTLTASEAAREDKSQPYFSGYNYNIFGIQAEAYWTAQYSGVKMSSFIAYRYIAKDDYGLRIFAGFNSLDDAVSAKIIACRNKGILTATDIDTFSTLYVTKWVGIAATPEAIKYRRSIYQSWGNKRFDQYKAGIY
jgi:hypothetical protein